MGYMLDWAHTGERLIATGSDYTASVRFPKEGKFLFPFYVKVVDPRRVHWRIFTHNPGKETLAKSLLAAERKIAKFQRYYRRQRTRCVKQCSK